MLSALAYQHSRSSPSAVDAPVRFEPIQCRHDEILALLEDQWGFGAVRIQDRCAVAGLPAGGECHGE